MNKWIKNCPKCGKEQVYTLKKNLNKAIRLNKMCRDCMFSSNEYRKKHIKNTTEMWKDLDARKLILKKRMDAMDKWKISALPTFTSNTYKEKQKKIQKDYLLSNPQKIEDDRKQIQKLWNDPTSVYYSDTFREKLRKARINQIQKLGVTTSNYNPVACRYFDNLNKEYGWELQHALNGGEIEVCGYFLDAYDKSRNIIVEYDEHQHYKYGGLLRERDIIRQQRLINHLKPTRFMRYNEKDNVLYDVVIRKEG